MNKQRKLKAVLESNSKKKDALLQDPDLIEIITGKRAQPKRKLIPKTERKQAVPLINSDIANPYVA